LSVSKRQPTPQPPPRRRLLLRRVLATALAVATLIGGTAAIVAFVPRVTVEWAGADDEKFAWQPSFLIKNINVIPLEDLGVYLVLCRILPNISDEEARRLKPTECSYHGRGSELFRDIWTHHRLAMDEFYTIQLTDLFYLTNVTNAYVDIAIRVRYYPWFLHVGLLQRIKTFRFIGRKLLNGRVVWEAYPLD
jgi:hypothetical protein